MGKVKKRRSGRTMALIKPRARATIRAEKKPEIAAPGTRNAVIMMANVAISQMPNNSIILLDQ